MEAREQTAQMARAAQADREKARQQLDQIPPPAKSRYLAVRTQDTWANPFLSVGPRDLTLRVLMPDANPSDMGRDSLLRPSSARRQTLTIRLADLPDALTALPAEAWPYGRVIAITETPTTEKALRPQIRRNVEATIQVLNDLGLVVDEWSGPNGGPLR